MNAKRKSSLNCGNAAHKVILMVVYYILRSAETTTRLHKCTHWPRLFWLAELKYSVVVHIIYLKALKYLPAYSGALTGLHIGKFWPMLMTYANIVCIFAFVYGFVLLYQKEFIRLAQQTRSVPWILIVHLMGIWLNIWSQLIVDIPFGSRQAENCLLAFAKCAY